METQNEKGGSAGSQGKTGQQQKGSGFSAQTHTTAAGTTGTIGSGSKKKFGNRGDETGDFQGEGDTSGNKNLFLTALGVLAGGVLLYKGAKSLGCSGKTAIDKKAILEIKSTQVIKRPKEELYAYWRNLENLPKFMSHIKDVYELNSKRSHWVAEVPGGMGDIEWEAEIVWEQDNQVLAWRSLPDSEIENSGEVRFHDSGNRKSTVVETTITYRPPFGTAGKLAAKLLNPAFKKVVESDLKEFKKLMESGPKRKGKASPASRM